MPGRDSYDKGTNPHWLAITEQLINIMTSSIPSRLSTPSVNSLEIVGGEFLLHDVQFSEVLHLLDNILSYCRLFTDTPYLWLETEVNIPFPC